ncbi:hypothetical protein D3C80_1635230 [compost metagenome]
MVVMRAMRRSMWEFHSPAEGRCEIKPALIAATPRIPNSIVQNLKFLNKSVLPIERKNHNYNFF